MGKEDKKAKKAASKGRLSKIIGSMTGGFRRNFLGNVEEDVAINNMPIKDLIEVIKDSERYLAKERGMLTSIPCGEFCKAATVSMSAGFCCACIPPVYGQRSLGLNTHFAGEFGGGTIPCSRITKVMMHEEELEDEMHFEGGSKFQNAPPMKMMMRASKNLNPQSYALSQWSRNWFFPINLITIPIHLISFGVGLFLAMPIYAMFVVSIPCLCLDMAITQMTTKPKKSKMLKVSIYQGVGDVTQFAFPKSEAAAVKRIFNFDIKGDKKNPFPATFWDKFLEGQDLAAIDAKVPKTTAGVIAEQNAALKTSAKAELDSQKADAKAKVQAEMDIKRAELKAKARAEGAAAWEKAKAQCAPLLAKAQDNLSKGGFVTPAKSDVDGALCAIKYAYAGTDVEPDAMGAYDAAAGAENEMTDLGGEAEAPAEPEEPADDDDGAEGETYLKKLLQPIINVLKNYSKPKNKLDLIYETKPVASGWIVHGGNVIQKEYGRFALYVIVSPKGEHYLVHDPKKQYQKWTKHSIRGLRAFNKAGADGKVAKKARDVALAASFGAEKAKGLSKGGLKGGTALAVNSVMPGDPFGLSGIINNIFDFDTDTLSDKMQFLPGFPNFQDLPFFDLLRIKRGFKDIIAEKCGKTVVDVGEDELPEDENAKGKKGKKGTSTKDAYPAATGPDKV